jgi:hypothetical protein
MAASFTPRIASTNLIEYFPNALRLLTAGPPVSVAIVTFPGPTRSASKLILILSPETTSASRFSRQNRIDRREFLLQIRRIKNKAIFQDCREFVSAQPGNSIR